MFRRVEILLENKNVMKMTGKEESDRKYTSISFDKKTRKMIDELKSLNKYESKAQVHRAAIHLLHKTELAVFTTEEGTSYNKEELNAFVSSGMFREYFNKKGFRMLEIRGWLKGIKCHLDCDVFIAALRTLKSSVGDA